MSRTPSLCVEPSLDKGICLPEFCMNFLCRKAFLKQGQSARKGKMRLANSPEGAYSARRKQAGKILLPGKSPSDATGFSCLPIPPHHFILRTLTHGFGKT